MVKRISLILLVFTSFITAPVRSQEADSLDLAVKAIEDSLLESFSLVPDDQVLQMIDQAVADVYAKTFINEQYPMTEEGPVKAEPIVAELDDVKIALKIEALNKMTPFELVYNDHVKAFIQLYLFKKREVTEKILGLAPYYYPLFEEELAKNNMPLELRYLPIVESALNPRAKSRAGAMGLWQFMYHTGKMYGLEVNSYYDERMDPIKSTVAACRYLNNLYSLYKDWSLVIAAYNCGPGNVNKAIRRSGGKKDFWEISKYLPKETRGYVPAFMAVNYVMNHHADHALRALKPEVDFYPTDTVHVCHQLTLESVSKTLGISQDWLRYFNPMYRLELIPESGKKLSICLPREKIGEFIVNEDSIYAFHAKKDKVMQQMGIAEEPRAMASEVIHRVRSGEALGIIANKYNCSVNDIKEWNKLGSSKIYPGQKLTIYTDRKPVANAGATKAPAPKESAPAETTVSGNYQYHIVQPGDTLWDIAKKYKEVTVNDLKKLNSNLDFRKLKPGDKIKISKVG